MTFAEEQTSAQAALDTLGQRADALVAAISADRDSAIAELASTQQQLNEALADDDTDTATITALRAQQAATQQKLDASTTLLTAAQAQAATLTRQLATATADDAADDAAIAALKQQLAAAQAAGGDASSADVALLAALVAKTQGPLPATVGPAGVTPVVSGAKVASPGVGTLNSLNAALPAITDVVLPKGTYSVRDFRAPANSPTYAHFLHKFGRLLGSGQADTIITLEPGSMDFTNTTDAEKKLRPRPETIPEPQTNPYNLARVDAATLVQDVTFLGTAQATDPRTGKEYSYHGLRFFGSKSPTLRRVTIRHIPGSKGVPPDETFPAYFYKVSGLVTIEDCLFDGDGVASSGISGQPANDAPLGVLINRTKIVGGPNGAGWTSFNRRFDLGVRIVDLSTDGSLVGANFEQAVVNGGNNAGNLKRGEGIVIVRPKHVNPSGYRPGEPTWKQAYWHLGLDASDKGGTNGLSVPGVSNRVDVFDPVLAPGETYKVCISAGYGYENVPVGAQVQRGSDIHVWTGGAWSGDPADPASRYIGGVERPDLLSFPRGTGAGLGG